MELGALLGLLALDAGFAGYRAAAGRNPRVRKLAWYRRAVLRGLVAGAVLDAVVVALVLGLGIDAKAAGVAMLQVFAPFAIAVIVSMLLWFSRSLDVRVLASVLVLGPFTLLRPVVIVAGVGWGWWQDRSHAGALVATVVVVGALGLEHVLRPAFQVPRPVSG